MEEKNNSKGMYGDTERRGGTKERKRGKGYIDIGGGEWGEMNHHHHIG